MSIDVGQHVMPDGEPDHVVTFQAVKQHALIDRLSGDRNPSHPVHFRAGIERPILHRVHTYGFTGCARERPCVATASPHRLDALSSFVSGLTRG